MAHHGAFPRPRVSLWVCTTAGLGLWGTPSAARARWQHALFYRRLGCLRATWGGGATYDWEGTHAAHRTQASSLAHAAPAVGTPDELLCEERAHARFGDWAVHPLRGVCA